MHLNRGQNWVDAKTGEFAKNLGETGPCYLEKSGNTKSRETRL